MSVSEKRALVDAADPKGISWQCELLGLARSSYYYEPLGESPLNLLLMKEMDQLFTAKPYFGRPRLTDGLRRLGYNVNPKRVGRLMQVMGIRAIYPRPRTTIPEKEYKKYPYLLRNQSIIEVNQVWCSDITYIPMSEGFLYLVAMMDWFSRYVLSWRISNCMDISFCIEALEEAFTQGRPAIFNSDKGGQYTSKAFTKMLQNNEVAISMSSRGPYDNIMVERLWRSVKYENVYLHDYQDGEQLQRGLEQYFQQYNCENPHSSLGMKTPFEVWNAAR
jgi:putative transposase